MANADDVRGASEKLRFHLVHGQNKHDVLLTSYNCNELTLTHLMREIEVVTGVPSYRQRIIFKGKSLLDTEAKLSTLGVRDCSKLMLIGKKVSEEEETFLRVIQGVDDGVTTTEKKLADISVIATDIERGFLAVELQPEALTSLTRQVAVCGETLTRHLEQLDALVLASCSAEVQNKRKSVIRRIQALLQKSDGLQHSLTEMMSRLHS